MVTEQAMRQQAAPPYNLTEITSSAVILSRQQTTSKSMAPSRVWHTITITITITHLLVKQLIDCCLHCPRQVLHAALLGSVTQLLEAKRSLLPAVPGQHQQWQYKGSTRAAVT
jgi:hypothetical protein